MALQPHGTLTIVTDNAFYAELLLDAMGAHGAFEGAITAGGKPADARLIRTVAPAARKAAAEKKQKKKAPTDDDARGGGARVIELVSAKPGAWCGHAASGASSYFDRLWQTGLSSHSAAHERFVLHVARVA